MAKEMAINLLRGSIFTRSLILEAVLESALEVAFESGGASIDPRVVGIFEETQRRQQQQQEIRQNPQQIQQQNQQQNQQTPHQTETPSNKAAEECKRSCRGVSPRIFSAVADSETVGRAKPAGEHAHASPPSLFEPNPTQPASSRLKTEGRGAVVYHPRPKALTPEEREKAGLSTAHTKKFQVRPVHETRRRRLGSERKSMA